MSNTDEKIIESLENRIKNYENLILKYSAECKTYSNELVELKTKSLLTKSILKEIEVIINEED